MAKIGVDKNKQVLQDYLRSIDGGVLPFGFDMIAPAVKALMEPDQEWFFDEVGRRFINAQRNWYEHQLMNAFNPNWNVRIPAAYHVVTLNSGVVIKTYNQTVVPKQSYPTNMAQVFKTLRELNGPWYAKINHMYAGGLNISMAYCVLCGRNNSSPSVPVVLPTANQWKPFWFSQETEEAREAAVTATMKLDGGNMLAALAGICNVSSFKCRSQCPNCGDGIGYVANLTEIQAWHAEGCCLLCAKKGLIAVEHPKLTRQGLRNYAEAFKRLKK